VRASIRSVASHLHFYESSDTGIERALGAVENAFAPAYRRLREADSLDAIGPTERAVITTYLAVQHVRTEEFRATVKGTFAEIDKWAKLNKHELDDELFTMLTTAADEEECRQIQVNLLANAVPKFEELIAQMKWMRFRNRTPMPLWTSDHPLTLFNPLTGDLGLACPGIQVFFPLSPTASLHLCDPIAYAALPNDEVIDDVRDVMFQNTLQVFSSTRFVFSQSDDFTLAEKILNKQPELSDPERRRTRISGVP
jgi:Protein of unknown function (DUF4238)